MLGGAEHFKLYVCHPAIDDAQLPGGTTSKVDDASLHEGPSIVDLDDDAFSIAQLGDVFLDFVHARLGKAPTELSLVDIEPDLILAFLEHLEQQRNNTVRSRNLRLTALRAFLKFAARRDVASLYAIERALGVLMKRFERPMLGFLSREEMLGDFFAQTVTEYEIDQGLTGEPRLGNGRVSFCPVPAISRFSGPKSRFPPLP